MENVQVLSTPFDYVINIRLNIKVNLIIKVFLIIILLAFSGMDELDEGSIMINVLSIFE